MRRGGVEGARSGGAGVRLRSRRRLAAAASLVALAGACTLGGGRRHPEPPEPALRLWTSGRVHWSDGRRDFGIALENGTSRTIEVETPDPRRARVVLYSDAGPDRVCGQDADASGPPDRAISLAPGEERGLRVDLSGPCGRIPPGEYRYEVGYEAPAVGPGPVVRLRPTYGHVVVEAAGPALERGSLGSGGEPGEGARRAGRGRRTRR